jgi:hypothetical protein
MTNSSTDAAELSSIATGLGDLATRIAAIADRRATGDDGDEVATGLFETERNLRTAIRRLDRVQATLR